MTIDVERDSSASSRERPCDLVGADMTRFYRIRPDVRFDVALSLRLVRSDEVTLAYIRTLNRGRRRASAVLDALVASADRHQVTLRLDARAEHDRSPGLDQVELERFYERRGFRTVDRKDGSAVMRRPAVPREGGSHRG
jgi:hypothetical protein